MIVVLDTNIWLSELGLRSILGSVARLYIRQKRAVVGLPEVVRLETERHLRKKLDECVETLHSTHRQLLAVLGALPELVVPSCTDIDRCVAELFGDLGIEVIEIPFSIESARASFEKTVRKEPPSDKTQEFKDGVLWADCLKLLATDNVALVTSDKAFFQNRDYSKGLAANLGRELKGASNTLCIYSTLEALVGEFQVDTRIDPEALETAYFDASLDSINRLLEGHHFCLGDRSSVHYRVFATEDPAVVFVEFELIYTTSSLIPSERHDGLLTLKGDCAFDLDRGDVAQLRTHEDTLRYVDVAGEEKQSRITHGFLESVLGHRTSLHTVRHPLFDGNG